MIIFGIILIICALSFLWVMSGPLWNSKFPQPIPSSWWQVRVGKKWVWENYREARIAELGSGWTGRWKSIANREGYTYTGYEIMTLLVWLSKVVRQILPYKSRVYFERKDITQGDLPLFDVYILFLGSSLNKIVADRLNHSCIIITPIFKIEETARVTLIKVFPHWTGNTYVYAIKPSV